MVNKKLFEERKNLINKFKKSITDSNISNYDSIPEGIFIKCDTCNHINYKKDFDKNLYVCVNCNNHFRISARDRIDITVDKNSFEELYANLCTCNAISFPNYEKKLEQYKKATGETEAFVCGTSSINGISTAIGVLNSYFMMGSMGNVVGEKVTRLAEYATSNKLPLLIFSASGGARMQEGIFSLMQMAKTSAAIKKHSNAGLLFISVLTNPTTGGVLASFASLGDIIIAEQNAIIGFAGKRVIEQTIKQKLPDNFQTSEFLFENGFLDIVVNRKKLKKTIGDILELHR